MISYDLDVSVSKQARLPDMVMADEITKPHDGPMDFSYMWRDVSISTKIRD